MTNYGNKMSIAKCLSQVETALVNFDLYESCYEGLLKIPFVSNLKEHNDQLIQQVKCANEYIEELKKMIEIQKEPIKCCSQNNNVSYTISESSSVGESESENCEESEYEEENESESDDDSDYETNDELEETEEVEKVEVEETQEVIEVEETQEVIEVEVIEVEEEVEVEEEEVEETEEVEVEEEEETEEEGVELIMIDDVNYFTSNTVNGEIYKYIDDENVGDLIGRFEESVPLWY